MTGALRFSHVALNCRDPGTTERFYTRHFGFHRARVVPLDDGQIVFLRSGDICLELFSADDGSGHVAPNGDGPREPGVRHFAFQVEDVDRHLRGMADEAHISLGPLDFGSVIPGWRTVWIRDPDGNIVEISQGYRDQEPLPEAGM